MRHVGGLIIVLIGTVALIAYGSFFFGRVTFGVDTLTYLYWSTWVPLGYPFFLSAIKNTLGLRWTGTIQIALLVASCVTVSLSLRRLTGRWITGAIALILLLGHTEVFHLHGVMFSEGLYIPLLLFNIGAAVFLIASQSTLSATMTGMTGAAAMFVRPAGYFIAMGPVFLLVCLRGSRRYVPLAALVVLLAGTWFLNLAIRGSAVQSQTGRVLFSQVAFLFEPQFVSSQHQKSALAVHEVIKPRRAEYEASKDREARVFYSMNDYNRRIDAIETALNDVCRSDTGTVCDGAVREALLRDFFYRTIINRPASYCGLVLDALIEAWRARIMDAWSGFYHDYRLEAAARPTRLEQIRINQLPLTPEDITLSPRLTEKWQGAIVANLDSIRVFLHNNRWPLYLAGAVSFLAMFVAPFTRSGHWLALGYCGVIIHGGMLMTAAVTVFIPRYAQPIDFVVMLAGVIFADWLYAILGRQIRFLYCKFNHTPVPASP
jgi:hypothetical protein